MVWYYGKWLKRTFCKSANDTMYMFTGKMSDVIFSEWSDLWNGLLSAP